MIEELCYFVPLNMRITCRKLGEVWIKSGPQIVHILFLKNSKSREIRVKRKRVTKIKLESSLI